jgi:hypothetical protein
MLRRFVVLGLALALAAPAAAQSTRVEAIANEQAKKATALKPEEAGDAELVVKRLTSALGRVPEGPYPWFGSVFPGGLFALGVGYARSLPRGSRINLLGAMSVEAYKLAGAEFSPRELINGRLQTAVGIEWIDAISVAFYGYGPGSENAKATYGYQPTTARANASFRAAPWLKIDGGYSYLHALSDGGDGMSNLFTPEETPGLDSSLGYDVPRIGITFDTRPSPSYSTRGVLLRGSWWRYRERSGQPYSFDKEEYEAGVLIPILREQFGVMFRALATMSTPDAGSVVPIMLAPDVGSGSTVRGFSNRRFQDNGRMVLNAEYRWRPSRYLDMAIFYDAGKVGPDWQSVRSGKYETGWGFGARLHGPTFTIWRVEIAHTKYGYHLVVASSSPF